MEGLPADTWPQAGAGNEPERHKPLPKKVVDHLREALEAERSRWFLWLPVVMACGIAGYFFLPVEPPLWAVAILAVAAIGGIMLLMRGRGGFFMALAVVFFTGFVIAKARVELAGPENMVVPAGYVEVKGWLEETTARPGGGTRMVVRPVIIDGLKPADIPKRLRLVWRGKQRPPLAGSFITIKAKFLPRRMPVWPGGYDAEFLAWFEGIGAQGFGVSAPQKIVPPTGLAMPKSLRFSAAIENLRKAIGMRILSALPGKPGALATALITGDRSGLDKELVGVLRSSGLAHLLAISGLHMALFAGGVFWIVRAILALNPMLAVTRPIKKYAALTAIGSGFFYLLISGMGVATQRAFIMISIMFIAVLVERPALTMRNVALAALVILLLRPESVMSVSFQMSFMAVVCLVGVYEWRAEVRARKMQEHTPGIFTSAWRYLAGLGLTTLVAGAATAPIAAYQFNRVAVFGVLANLAALPLVGALIMPMAVAALVLMPFGLETYPLWIMGQGLELVLAAASWVAGLGGAVRPLAAMPLAAPMVMAGGLLWLSLWQTRWRLVGLGVIAAGFLIVPSTRLPDVLAGADGKLIAIKTANGFLSLNTARSEKYTAERWLAKFGDTASLQKAAARKGIVCDRQGCSATLPSGAKIALVHSPAILDEECRSAQIVIVSFRMRGPCPSAKVLISRKDLKRAGMHAIYISRVDGKPRFEIKTAQGTNARRPWTAREKWFKRQEQPVLKAPQKKPAPTAKQPPLQVKI